MKNELTREFLRNLLDECCFVTRIDKEGDICALLDADDDFPHDVVLYFLIREGWMGMHAFVPDWNLNLTPEQQFHIENRFNSERKLPKLYFRDDTLILEHWIVIESNFSKTFIINSIKYLTGIFWKSFYLLKDIDK